MIMDLKENKNDLEIEDVSNTKTNFRSLYGLTPEVENARGNISGTVLVNGAHAVGDTTIAVPSNIMAGN